MEYSVDFKNIKGDFNIVLEIDDKVTNIPTPLDKQGVELILEDIIDKIIEQEDDITLININNVNNQMLSLKLFIDDELKEFNKYNFYFNNYMDEVSPDDCSITYKKLKYDKQ